jgi:hypothetical protein
MISKYPSSVKSPIDILHKHTNALLNIQIKTVVFDTNGFWVGTKIQVYKLDISGKNGILVYSLFC